MFSNIQEYYTFLDSDTCFKESLAVSNKLKSLLQLIKSEKEKSNCFLEICFHDFHFRQGEFVPLWSTSENCYPALEQFKDTEYFRQRTLNTLNNKFKAKYFHLLYLKSNDNRDAKKAIDCYFEFLKETNLDLNENLEIIGFIGVFDNLVFLSKKVKYQQSEVCQFGKVLIQEGKLSGYVLFHTIDFLSNNLKLTPDLNQFLFDVIVDELEAVNHPNYREDFLKLSVHLAQKVGKQQTEYQNLLGEFYIQKAKKEGESFVVHPIYLEALNIFKKAGNKEKQDEVSTLLIEAKRSLNLNSVKQSFEIPLIDYHFKSMDNLSTELAQNNSSQPIYEYLIGQKIFPSANLLEKFAKPQTFDLMTTIAFDKNKNISVNNSKGFNDYQMHFQLFSMEHLRMIFHKGQENGKISFDSLKEYLENNTWYNENNSVLDSVEKTTCFKWVDLILPSIKLYFEHSEKDNKNGTNCPEGYILSIDSLTLKFEGVLRDFSNKIGAQTIESEGSKTEERIDFEKLFNNEKFQRLVPEDDVAFFKFLFTRKGLNLRNNIAHCFYSPDDYSPSLFWLLICAFLKLGNFEFKPVN